MQRFKLILADLIVKRAVKAFNKAYARVSKAQDMLAKSIEEDLAKENKLRDNIQSLVDQVHIVEQEKADKSDKMQRNSYLLRNLEQFMQEDDE